MTDEHNLARIKKPPHWLEGIEPYAVRGRDHVVRIEPVANLDGALVAVLVDIDEGAKKVVLKLDDKRPGLVTDDGKQIEIEAFSRWVCDIAAGIVEA